MARGRETSSQSAGGQEPARKVAAGARGTVLPASSSSWWPHSPRLVAVGLSLMPASSLSFLHTSVPVSTLLPLTDASAVGSVPHPVSSSHPGTSTKTLCPNEVASQMPGVSSTSVSEGGNSARDTPAPPLFTSAPAPAPQLLLCSPVPGGGRSEVRQWSVRARLRREVLFPTAASSHPHRVHDEAAEGGGGDGPHPRSRCPLRGNSKVGAGSHTSPPHP